MPRRPTRHSGAGGAPEPSPDAAVYVISVAAELTGLHPQTLRTYERQGLITPGRTGGGGRRYSHSDIEALRVIADLTAHGIGLEGVRRILELENRLDAVTRRNEELVAETDALREALRAAAGRRTDESARSTPPAGNLPVLRTTPAGQVMVWRRGRP